MTADELTAKYDAWHVFTSDTGRFWAARPSSDLGGSGETVDADTDEGMDALLAARGAA